MDSSLRKPLFFEEERLNTFHNWPYNKSQRCNPKKMAEAGWYAVDPENCPDLAQCFFCDKQLDGWESDDDPWGEHRKHTKNCMFVKLGKNEADITVREHIHLASEVNKKVLIEKAKYVKADLVEEKKKMKISLKKQMQC